jgi:hypothetical protein
MWGFGTSRRIIFLWLHFATLKIISPGIAAISDSVNLNEYVDVFPSNYFVKIYFDTLVSENLGPSKIPLTLLKFNYRNFLIRYNTCPKYPSIVNMIQNSSIEIRQ